MRSLWPVTTCLSLLGKPAVPPYAGNRISSASIAKSFECATLLIRKYWIPRRLVIFHRSSVAISRQLYRSWGLQQQRSSRRPSTITKSLVFQSETTAADILGYRRRVALLACPAVRSGETTCQRARLCHHAFTRATDNASFTAGQASSATRERTD